MCLLFVSLALTSFPLTIQASRVLDGKGGVLRNVRLTVKGTKIIRVEPGSTAPTDFMLRDMTLMPGWIDTHDHIVWHFNKDDRADTSKESPTEFALNAAGNAYITLMAGFTTIQSLGAPVDADLRDAIARKIIPGPRIITSLQPLTEKSGTPDEIRALVRK